MATSADPTQYTKSDPRFRAEAGQFLRQLASDPGTEIIGPYILLYERGLDLYARRP